MTTVTQAFDQLRNNLELTESERTEASRQQNVVRENLRVHLGGIARDIISGSYGRRTAIRPLHDIDLFIILDKTAHAGVYPPATPKACLNKVLRALDVAYPTKDRPRLQGRSVHIELSGTGIGYDVVPAFEIYSGQYIIPDRGRDAWINTNPERHRDALVSANERAGGKLNFLIKAAKHWNVQNGKPLVSFHLEVMAYGAFYSAPATYPEGLRDLFAHLAGRVLSACPDPAGLGPHVDEDLSWEARVSVGKKLTAAAADAKRAIEHDWAGRTEQAHAIWRSLLGRAYPA